MEEGLVMRRGVFDPEQAGNPDILQCAYSTLVFLATETAVIRSTFLLISDLFAQNVRRGNWLSILGSPCLDDLMRNEQKKQKRGLCGR